MPSSIAAEIASGTGKRALVFDGAVTIPDVRPWWPHTHGSPHLYDARLIVGGVRFELGRVGFRELRAAGDLERDGIQLDINGAPVFARGAVWTPIELTSPHGSAESCGGYCRRSLTVA